jgi:hypothetical protein
MTEKKNHRKRKKNSSVDTTGISKIMVETDLALESALEGSVNGIEHDVHALLRIKTSHEHEEGDVLVDLEALRKPITC